MSEKNGVDSPNENDGNIENGNEVVKENIKTTLPSEESPCIESTDVFAEQDDVQDIGQLNEPYLPEEQIRSHNSRCIDNKVEASDLSPENQPTPPDAPTETKSLEKKSDIDHDPTEKCQDILPSLSPSSDKILETAKQDIQFINEGLKEMKLSESNDTISASAKKGRKPGSTTRARSTPILTSPPLTRSRSRDLKKFPSTPSSPRRLAVRKGSESDSDEIKGIRGRPRTKKN